jgi:hypothetical protein
MSSNRGNPKIDIDQIKTNLNLFNRGDSESINYKRYSFVTMTLILSAIYFIFTLLFILVAGTISVMISYFLQRYNLTSTVLGFALWQKIVMLEVIVFLVANFCLFEADAFVGKLIYKSEQKNNTDDLKSILKVRPKNWQKIFYSLILTAISLLIGYLFVIYNISWNYNQFWNQ